MRLKDFSGEIYLSVRPGIMGRLSAVNEEPPDGKTGKDAHSLRAIELMRRELGGEDIDVTFALNGTAANILALKAMLDRWSCVLCADQTHINTYECGAFEYTLGNKILSVPCADGKITVSAIADLLLAHKKHGYLPKVLVLTQPTELGTVYTVQEMRALTEYAHGLGMYVYIDGARIGCATEALGISLGEQIVGTDADAFSFGGTKMGAMFGEMVVFRKKRFGAHLDYLQKQSMQHLDKSKFLGAQLEYLLETGFWKEFSRGANAAAKRLGHALVEKGVPIYYPVETNMVFGVLPPERFAAVERVYDLHYWDEFAHVVRLAATADTTDAQIAALAALL